MAERYAKHYCILGVPSGASWKELRKAYKSLVNTWHPDRFQQDARQKRLAEEKTKEINQSFKELADYYKKFGILPPVTETLVDSVAEHTARQSASVAQPTPEAQGTEQSDTVISPAPTPKSPRSSLRAQTLVAVALVGAVYFIWQLPPQEDDPIPPANVEFINKAVNTQNDGDSNHHTSDEKYFDVGSSIGEVYTAQGVPTATEDNIWHYGKSKVYFDKGRVLRWEENPDYPLRIRKSLQIGEPSVTFFGKGSSKKEVIAIQGTPDRDAGNVWDYGVSRVYFENGHVKSWDESPLNPLKVQR